MTKYVGAHVSISGGIWNAPLNAMKLGAKAFALFTKNQRQWKEKIFTEEEIGKFKEALKESKISSKQILPHDSYLVNLGHPDKDKRKKSLDAFIGELKRCEQLGLDKVNFHPGSHLREISEEKCLDIIADSMNYAINAVKNNVKLVIENTAGQGSNVGYKFEHLAHIIDKVENKKGVGVCLDTCHTFAAGYDMRTKDTYEATMKEFGKVVGFKYLMGVHLNDCKTKLGSKVDRHDSIGKGELGIDAFKYIMNDKRMDSIPLVLETPNSELWEKEIEILYGLIE